LPHRLPVQLRLIWLIELSVLLPAASGPVLIAVALSLSGAGVAFGALPRMRAGLRSIRWLLFSVALVALAFTPGVPLFEGLPGFSRDGAFAGLRRVLLMSDLVLAVAVLLQGVSPQALADAVLRLLYAVPACSALTRRKPRAAQLNASVRDWAAVLALRLALGLDRVAADVPEFRRQLVTAGAGAGSPSAQPAAPDGEAGIPIRERGIAVLADWCQRIEAAAVKDCNSDAFDQADRRGVPLALEPLRRVHWCLAALPLVFAAMLHSDSGLWMGLGISGEAMSIRIWGQIWAGIGGVR